MKMVNVSNSVVNEYIYIHGTVTLVISNRDSANQLPNAAYESV